ncbi:MAG: GNAT family N-acetyltransferase, partial [Chloroflexota bacterium]
MAKTNVEEKGPLQFKALNFFEHWRTVGYMYQNYLGVDKAFEETALGILRRPFLRWIGFPLYFALRNEGYTLRLNQKFAGVLYLQYRKRVTHINDIEVNRAYQGQGLGHHLLAFADKKARENSSCFITLVVTLSNTRALNLYRKSGFLDQHHCYYYLSRAFLRAHTSLKQVGKEEKLTLKPLSRKQATKNLQHFFQLETRSAKPVTGEVWEALYPPQLPRLSKVRSYALFWGTESQPGGHLDFFTWGSYGRWRIYLPTQYWGTEDELALFELLIRYKQSPHLRGLGIMVGSTVHHVKALPLAQRLNFAERSTERMLMIKPLSNNPDVGGISNPDVGGISNPDI